MLDDKTMEERVYILEGRMQTLRGDIEYQRVLGMIRAYDVYGVAKRCDNKKGDNNMKANKKKINEKINELTSRMTCLENEVDRLKKEIDILKVTGSFDADAIKVEWRASGYSEWAIVDGEISLVLKKYARFKYVKNRELVTIDYELGTESSRPEIKILTNSATESIVRIGTKVLRLDKQKEAVIEIPALDDATWRKIRHD